MPFTPPSTYPSQANTGYATLFQIGTLASPPVYSSILEIKSIAPNLISMSEVQTTHLLSPLNTEEFIPSMIKPGKIALGGNFVGDATQLSITTLAQAQTIFPFKVIAPMSRQTKTYTLSGSAFVADYKNGPFEINKAIEYAVEIQMTGAYTEVVA